MNDPKNHIFESNPQCLAKILSVDDSTQDLWRTDDLGAIYRHQLAATICIDFASAGSRLGRKLDESKLDPRVFQQTFSEALFGSQPNMELLQLIKVFAKEKRSDPNSPLPKPVALVLYFGAIAAMTLCGETISKLSSSEQRDGIEWGIDLPWIDNAMRELLKEGIAYYDSH